MQLVSFAVLMAALSVAGVARAQIESTDPEPTITVTGQAELRLPAEDVTVSARIFARAETSEAALQTASDTLNAITDAISRLEGLEKYQFDADNAQAQAVRDADCRSEALYLRDDRRPPPECEPIAFITTVSFTLEVEPAAIAGNVVSTLSEVGAEDARIVAFGLLDRAAAQRQARQAATQDALATAAAVADAAGARVGAIRSVSVNDGGVDRIQVTGSRLERRENDDVAFSPAVSLELPEPIVQIESRVAITLELESRE